MDYFNMELEEIFRECNIPDQEGKDCARQLELKTAADLALFADRQDIWKEAGIVSLGAQVRIARIAKLIATELEEQERQNNLSAQNMAAAIIPQTTMLAQVVDDDELLAKLRQAGVLRFDSLTYLAGVKSMIAAKYGVFKGVNSLMQLLYNYAVSNSMPVPAAYYELKALQIRRSLGQVFAIVQVPESLYDGIPVYATESEARRLVERIEKYIIPALVSARDEVVKWYKNLLNLKQGEFFINQTAQQTGVVSFSSYPKFDAMLEAGKNLRLAINAALAGDEMPHAIALYNEYRDFVRILDEPELPSYVGAVDRDKMLALLGFDANSALLRSEKYLTQFMMSMIEVEKLSAPNEGIFFQELNCLLQQIDWDALLHDEHKKHPAQPEPEPLANPFQSALCDLEANNTVEVINEPTIAEDTTKWLPQEERVGISQMNGDRIAILEAAN